MEQFISFPHFPAGQVTLAAVSGERPEILEALSGQGVRPLPVPESPVLPGPVASHADMRLFYFGKGKMLAERGDRGLCRLLEEAGISVQETEQPLLADYPGDIALNCFALGGLLVGHGQGMDAAIRRWGEGQGLLSAAVRQGYAKCSCALVSPRAVITADRGISRALVRYGIDCLTVRSGHVRLEGYDTGFIGGCCFLLAPDTLAFIGNLDTHPDSREIRAFCARHGVKCLSLLGGELWDIGSVLPLAER